MLGHHVFECFGHAYGNEGHARRYLWLVDVRKNDGQIWIDVRGNAFCHNQVRIIAGTLVDIGLGRFSPRHIEEMLAAKDRTKAGRTAPAQGLTLERVYYPDDLQESAIPAGAVFPRYPVNKDTWPFSL